MSNSTGVSRAIASDSEHGWNTFIVSAGEQQYPIQYWISGGRLIDMVPDLETNSFTITISSDEDGTLTIRLPRELVDSRAGTDNRSGADTEFAVFVDEEIVNPEEIEMTSMARTLLIDFDRGATTIEAVGTLTGMSVPSPSEWKTTHVVGTYHPVPGTYSDKPDQVFKMQYRVINGTIDKLSVGQTKVSSSGNGTLEIKFPRNYPYTNEDASMAPISVRPMVFFDAEPYDETIDITYSEITDCFFIFSIPFTGNKSIGLVWAYLLWERPAHGDDIPHSCLTQTLVDNVPTRKDGTISPLRQFKAGVAAEDVVCRQTMPDEKPFTLMISPDGKPYCVKISNEGFMRAKGWTDPK